MQSHVAAALQRSLSPRGIQDHFTRIYDAVEVWNTKQIFWQIHKLNIACYFMTQKSVVTFNFLYIKISENCLQLYLWRPLRELQLISWKLRMKNTFVSQSLALASLLQNIQKMINIVGSFIYIFALFTQLTYTFTYKNHRKIQLK